MCFSCVRTNCAISEVGVWTAADKFYPRRIRVGRSMQIYLHRTRSLSRAGSRDFDRLAMCRAKQKSFSGSVTVSRCAQEREETCVMRFARRKAIPDLQGTRIHTYTHIIHTHNHLFLSFFCAVPPTIAPFSFKKDLSEGLRAQVTCMVEKGDPPFTIIWSKDGEPISAPGTAVSATINDPRHSQTPPGLRVTNIDAHSSAIVIERVTAAHTGNYTCLARNSVAEVLWTAELIVRGKVESQLPWNASNLCLFISFFSLFLFLSHIIVLHLAAHHYLRNGTVTANEWNGGRQERIKIKSLKEKLMSNFLKKKDIKNRTYTFWTLFCDVSSDPIACLTIIIVIYCLLSFEITRNYWRTECDK